MGVGVGSMRTRALSTDLAKKKGARGGKATVVRATADSNPTRKGGDLEPGLCDGSA